MTTVALRWQPLRRLPRRLPPLLNETVDSYLWRLAEANGLTGPDLHLHLAGSSTKASVTAEQVAAISGYPARTLRYAMLELCTPADLETMQIIGRPLPSPSGWDHNWPHNRTRTACRRCAAQRGVTRRGHRRPILWTTHENVVCRRHRRWLGGLHQDTQPDLTHLPDIVAANRRHRRLIRLHGREQVRFATIDAARIYREWTHRSWGGYPADQRIFSLQQQGEETRFVNSPAVEAAVYPEIVALARLFASPYWRRHAMTDNLNAEPLDHAMLDKMFGEIAAGTRDPNDIPEDLHAAAAGVLRSGPSLARFTSEIQRTVNPHYRWRAWSHHRKFPPITQWIMDQIEAIKDPLSYEALRHRREPPECYDRATGIPHPRREPFQPLYQPS